MLDELMVESHGNMKRKSKTGMNGGIECNGPADTQNTLKDIYIYIYTHKFKTII